jgi:hypothetical protein
LLINHEIVKIVLKKLHLWMDCFPWKQKSNKVTFRTAYGILEMSLTLGALTFDFCFCKLCPAIRRAVRALGGDALLSKWRAPYDLEESVIHSQGLDKVVPISSKMLNEQTIRMLALSWRRGCLRAATSGGWVFAFLWVIRLNAVQR